MVFLVDNVGAIKIQILWTIELLIFQETNVFGLRSLMISLLAPNYSVVIDVNAT